MPPCLDIYAFSHRRDREIIERFIDRYVDRSRSEIRPEEEEIVMLRLDVVDDSPQTPNPYEGEPAKTLSHVIERGLDYPRRSFTFYLSSKQPAIYRVILHFTNDDKIVFGLSIDDEEESDENSERAKKLLNELCLEFGCKLGLITCENPPPRNELAFKKEAVSELAIHKVGV